MVAARMESQHVLLELDGILARSSSALLSLDPVEALN
jgi:hypothetical protein